MAEAFSMSFSEALTGASYSSMSTTTGLPQSRAKV